MRYIMKTIEDKRIKPITAKIFWVMIVLSLTISISGCDPVRYYSFYLVNDCEEPIEAKIVNFQKKESNLQIDSKTEQLICTFDNPQPLNIRVVEGVFEKIIVTKGNDTSKVNYIDKDLWRLTSPSKNRANCYLVVNPEDF